MMKGYRKLVMVAIIGAITALVPEVTGHDLSANQVDILKNLIMAAFGGNIVEHLTGVLKEYNANRVRPAGRPVHSVRAVSDPEQAPANDRH